MRKRIIIGLLAVVVIGVVAFYISQPKKGSVEWHAREYEGLLRRIEGKTLKHRCARVWAAIRRASVPPPLTFKERQALLKELSKQQRIVIRCGYLIERRFVITNYDARVLEARMSREWNSSLPSNRVYHTWLAGARGADILVVVGQPKDMPFWEKMIGKADVPEGGK